jgi:hypothetical protein
MNKISGRGAEEAAKLPARLILCDLEDANKIFLAVVRKPYLGPISKDRYDDRQKDLSPPEQRKAANGVPQNPEHADGAPGSCSKGLHMKTPGEAGGEEDPEVAEGGGRRNVDRGPHPVP